MYDVTDQLKKTGFSINTVKRIVERNNGSLDINTQEYFCILVAMDDFEINIQGRLFSVKDGSMLFAGPHKEVSLSNIEGKEIYNIAFSAAFYEQSSIDSLFLNSTLFFNYESDVFIVPISPSKEIIRKFIIDRLGKFLDKSETLYISAAHHTVKALILDAMLFADDHQIEITDNLDYVSCVNRFRVLLQKDFKEHKIVSYYAQALNVTSRKLTEMTEFVTGKTAKQIITEKVIAECYRLLKYSGFTISEISFRLGFSNEGNFTHFIKKHTGKNPSEIKAMSDSTSMVQLLQ
ncbi:helix-turn-helix domain-containing protein [Chryseobacterium caseinilyticum]|uniref:Helix-turn-helix domain-containing protein n=1 Tax=Chryseobacterium caseinilyticum TaxID=2771428 RepID=A0ABR8Z6D7_9FLAO|nr:helix-turn-helix domain-containing protein [Chryseobacterium caseinilyticum]MBD8080852.1 helix-turn-helix domain-containing protein [Chryseobacterium caseinilyticum]